MGFANPYIVSAFSLWDALTLPSTGSHHTPMRISLHPPPLYNEKPRTHWQDADWPTGSQTGKSLPPPETPSPNQLDQWFSSALTARTTTIEATAPRSRPSQRSKHWCTPLLTTLRKEFTKATRMVKKSQNPDTFLTATLSKLSYFKAIKKAKASYWADFFAKTSSNNIWTAKQLVARRKTP